MGRGRNPYFVEEAIVDIRPLLESVSREALRDFGRMVRDMDRFVSVDESTGDKELSLADVIKDARKVKDAGTRGFLIGTVSGYEYYLLTFGPIQSFASFVGDILVVLWFGSSSLNLSDQRRAKNDAVSRLRNYLEGIG